MTREGNPISPGQQGKTVVQAIEDLLDRQDPGPHRRQLDRQWQTVEPPAQPDDRHPVRVAQLEMARRRRRPLGEQHDGLVLLQLGERSPRRLLEAAPSGGTGTAARPALRAAPGWS